MRSGSLRNPSFQNSRLRSRSNTDDRIDRPARSSRLDRDVACLQRGSHIARPLACDQTCGGGPDAKLRGTHPRHADCHGRYRRVCAINGVRHIRRSGGNQYGDAIRTGIAEARGKYLLCMDADGSHSASYFASMWAERERFDIVIGSRYVSGATPRTRQSSSGCPMRSISPSAWSSTSMPGT